MSSVIGEIYDVIGAASDVIFNKGPYLGKGSVLMIDMVDPDNQLTALAFAKTQATAKQIAHIVCVGRPVSFAKTRFNPQTMTFFSTNEPGDETETKMDFKVNVREGKTEYLHHDVHDAELLLKVNMQTLYLLIEKDLGLDVAKNVKIWNGGIAAKAGLSYAIHDHEDLFTTYDRENGLCVTDSETYLKHLSILHFLSPTERKAYRTDKLVARVKLFEELQNIEFETFDPVSFLNPKYVGGSRTLQIFLGGPCTALAKLIHPGAPALKYVLDVRAMICSLPGDQNLLGDNFNIQTDWDSFEKVFINTFENEDFTGRVHIYPTGTCKQGWLNFTPEQVKTLDLRVFSEIHSLWTTLKKSPQPMFDVCIMFPVANVPFQLVPMKLKIGTVTVGDSSFKRCDLVPFVATEASETVKFLIFNTTPCETSTFSATKETGIEQVSGLFV